MVGGYCRPLLRRCRCRLKRASRCCDAGGAVVLKLCRHCSRWCWAARPAPAVACAKPARALMALHSAAATASGDAAAAA